MSSSEKFSLNLNEFQKNISSAFQEMRDDDDLADVTLVCENKKQFKAHKFVLSACSPFFKEILRNNKHPHPLIYLKGMTAIVLESVLEFLYRGEVNIYQNDLEGFMAVADELELNGVLGQQENLAEPQDEDNLKEVTLKKKTKQNPNMLLRPKEEFDMFLPHKSPSIGAIGSDIVSVEDPVINVKNHELKETIKTLLEKKDGKWRCKMCGQTNGHQVNIKRHIESKHTAGGSYPCKVCGKIFRSSNPLNIHMSIITISGLVTLSMCTYQTTTEIKKR